LNFCIQEKAKRGIFMPTNFKSNKNAVKIAIGPWSFG